MFMLDDSIIVRTAVTYNNGTRVWEGYVNSTVPNNVMKQLVRDGFIQVTPAHSLDPGYGYQYEKDAKTVFIPLHNVLSIQ